MTKSGNAEWIPLMDYAMKKGVSLSTLRRYIKSNKVTYRVEGGRYLLMNDSDSELQELPPEEPSPKILLKQIPVTSEPRLLQMAVHQLKSELMRANEEIAELKTLIALYEETMPQSRLDV